MTFCCTQIGRLAGGLGQPLPPQVFAGVAWRGAVGWRGVQHEVLGAGGGDDARRQEDVDDRLQQQEDFGLLQVGAVCRGRHCTTHGHTEQGGETLPMMGEFP